jgi:hypothetical protein
MEGAFAAKRNSAFEERNGVKQVPFEECERTNGKKRTHEAEWIVGSLGNPPTLFPKRGCLGKLSDLGQAHDLPIAGEHDSNAGAGQKGWLR